LDHYKNFAFFFLLLIAFEAFLALSALMKREKNLPTFCELCIPVSLAWLTPKGLLFFN